MQEQEFKFQLTQAEHEKLFVTLQPLLTQKRVLWNNYYDTPNMLLDKAGCTVRLRVGMGVTGLVEKASIDFKGDVKKEGHLRISEEVTHSISLPDPLPSGYFNRFNCLYTVEQMGEVWTKIAPIVCDHPVWLIGGIRVIRKVCLYKGLTLELDEIDYDADLIEYELECETEDPDKTYAIIVDLLKQHGIEPKIAKHGKRKRFLKLKSKYPHVGHTYNVLRIINESQSGI